MSAMVNTARISSSLERFCRVIASNFTQVSVLRSGISGHTVLLIDSDAGEFVLKVYGVTGHAARENEVLGFSNFARWGISVPTVIWQSDSLNAAAFTVVRGEEAVIALRDENPWVIGKEIGEAIFRYSTRSRTPVVRCVGPISSGKVPDEIIRYTLSRASQVYGEIFAGDMAHLVASWHQRLTPQYASAVTFDSKLDHFIFDGPRLSGVIDLEHWDTFDPAVDVGDLLCSLQESNVALGVRHQFLLGLAQGLDTLFLDIVARLPFYIGRRYLIGSELGMQDEIMSKIRYAANFWLTKIRVDIGISWLLAATESAPTVKGRYSR